MRRSLTPQQLAAIFAKNPRLKGIKAKRVRTEVELRKYSPIVLNKQIRGYNDNSIYLQSGPLKMSMHHARTPDNNIELYLSGFRNTKTFGNIGRGDTRRIGSQKDVYRLLQAVARHVGKNKRIISISGFLENPKSANFMARLGGSGIKKKGHSEIIDISEIRSLINELRKTLGKRRR